MLEAFKDFNAGWGAIVYLLLGGLLGVLFSTHAQRPKLRVSGYGSGGNSSSRDWRLTITNRPSFLWRRFYGESAHDVHLRLRKLGRDPDTYVLYWGANPSQQSVTIDPGKSAEFTPFVWRAGYKGYLVLDYKGDPVAHFEDAQAKFVLTSWDRLGRSTSIPISVTADPSLNGGPPTLKLYTPWPFSMRISSTRGGIKLIGMGLQRKSWPMVRGGFLQIRFAWRRKPHW